MASLVLRNCLLKSSGNHSLLVSSRALHATASRSAVPFGAERKKWVDEGMTDVISAQDAEAKKYSAFVDENTKRWNKYHEIYYGKDRDFVNYPTLRKAEYHPKVRMGIIPDEWFRMFYPKTGTLGPYLFMGGLTVTAFSKEWMVMVLETNQIWPFVICTVAGYKFLGPKMRPWFAERQRKAEDYLFNRPLERFTKDADKQLATADTNLAQLDALKHTFQAKREQVDLQLESAYRQRLVEFNQTVKRRLDYHIERENTRRRFQQQYMVRWIVDNVVKSITPAQERATLNKCIADLKALSARA